MTDQPDSHGSASLRHPSLDDVLSSSATGVVTLNREGRLLAWNAAALWLLGVNKAPDGTVPSELGDLWLVLPLEVRGPKGTAEVSHWAGELTRRGSDGLSRTLAVEVAVRRDERGLAHELSALLRDVSDAQRLHRELLHQASHDSLTGLANRARFRRATAEAVERVRHDGGAVAVLFVDLDRLKEINDAAGHEVGDRVIVHAGERLVSSVRPTDLVARLGGDEFVVLCEQITDAHAALEIAERVRRSLSERTEIDGLPTTLGASLGVAVLEASKARNDDRSPLEVADSLLQESDSAMYLAKERGRSRSEVFDDDLGKQVARRRRRGLELADALRAGAVACQWTPVVDLANDTVTAWMLGATWRTPDGEELSHHEVVEVATRAGLGRHLGDWLMRHAIGPLPEPGRPSIIVPWNTSQLRDPDAVDAVRAVLNMNPDDRRRIMVSLDEAMLARSDTEAERTLRSLTRFGVTLGVTGVGGGATPLQRLTDLPVERLMLHHSVVAELGTSRASDALTAALIQVGHALDVVVGADVGSGDPVTLARRTERLRTLGCDDVMGRRSGITVTDQELTAI